MREISAELTQAIKPTQSMLKIMWFGQFFALGIYVYISHVQAVQGDGMSNGKMLPVLAILVSVVLVTALLLRWFTLSPRAIAQMLEGRQPRWTKMIVKAQSGYPIGKPPLMLSRLTGEELKLYEYSRGLLSAVVIQWGLAHTCALYGMILTPVQYQPLGAIATALLSAGTMLLLRPGLGRPFAAGLELAEFERGINRDA